MRSKASRIHPISKRIPLLTCGILLSFIAASCATPSDQAGSTTDKTVVEYVEQSSAQIPSPYAEPSRGTVDVECGMDPVAVYLDRLGSMLPEAIVVTATVSATTATRVIVDDGDPEVPENLVYTKVSLEDSLSLVDGKPIKASTAWMRGGVHGDIEYRYTQGFYAWSNTGKAVVVLSRQADGQLYVGGLFPIVKGQVLLDLSCITSEGVEEGQGTFTGHIQIAFAGQPEPVEVNVGTISLDEFTRLLLA